MFIRRVKTHISMQLQFAKAEMKDSTNMQVKI